MKVRDFEILGRDLILDDGQTGHPGLSDHYLSLPEILSLIEWVSRALVNEYSQRKVSLSESLLLEVADGKPSGRDK